MIEAGNATVAGMTAAEAAAALGAVDAGKMVAYNVIQTTGGEIIQLTGATASEAIAAYEAAGGVISAAGAATEGAAATANLTEIITLPGTAGEAVATGGILSLSLPAWVAAAAPLLGVAVGAGLYELSPTFWEKVSRALLPFAWNDTEVMPAVVDANGQAYIEGEALEALKQLFIDEGLPMGGGDEGSAGSAIDISPVPNPFLFGEPSLVYIGNADGDRFYFWEGGERASLFKQSNKQPHIIIFASSTPFTLTNGLKRQDGSIVYQNTESASSYTRDGKTVYRKTIEIGTIFAYGDPITAPPINEYTSASSVYAADSYSNYIAWTMIYGDITVPGDYPDGMSEWEGDPVPDYTSGGIEVVKEPGVQTQPYYPVQLPIGDPLTSNDPLEYPSPNAPSPLPSISPHIAPEVAPNQYPEEYPISSPDEVTAPLENPLPAGEPVFDPNSDPSSQPETSPDPAENPPPVPSSTGISPLPVMPSPFPDIVPSSDTSGLIHVYNPTSAEMISFGRWLWVTYADATIDKIWNNPFDGILGAFELYATPSTRTPKENIRSGFLVSDTQAAVVDKRYISINCGAIVIPEEYGNYLDYSPYTKVYAYLPFIGIVELDADDIVGHGINITYYIDTYNGSCIAQITVAKSGYSNTIYQFSGNCAVDVPMSGGSQAAIKAGLIGAAATGIASVVGGIATGLTGNAAGAVGGIAYGLGGAIAHAVSQKSSVQHSGTFGASYGAMGAKIPYIIVKRPIQKQVWNYNRDYGFQAHKRVVIGSCHGFLRVREVNVISTSATDEEKKLIEDLLKEGVYVD